MASFSKQQFVAMNFVSFFNDFKICVSLVYLYFFILKVEGHMDEQSSVYLLQTNIKL